ncbi:methylenetetrahydrofolate reductase [Boseaceae bacterium BT-24-1]|nr:methylenetetrahydrofolate reductase [Boseaceae bacterium BT-24-1]
MTGSLSRLPPSQGTLGNLIDGFSLEMTARDSDALAEAAPDLPAATRIAVTYLPGEDMSARVAAAAMIRSYGHIPVPHISARRLASALELERFLDRLSTEASIDRAFVVGGDLREPAGPYPDAKSVIASGLLAKFGLARIGVAGYPEGHPSISEHDLKLDLLTKLTMLRDLGHEGVVNTQFSFDAGAILRWLEALRNDGVTATVRIGIPGPTTVKSLLRFAARCGVGASTAVLQKYGISLTRLLSPVGPDRLLAELGSRLSDGAHGDVKLHFYPFGGLARTARWAKTLIG